MFAVAVFVVVLIAFWVYVRWGGKRLREAPVVPLERAEMEAGYKPRAIARWPVFLAVAFFAVLLSFVEWQAPSRPPFTGRWSAVNAVVFEALGETGLLAVYIVAAAVFAGAAIASFLGTRR